MKWTRKAAEQGIVAAQIAMGFAYRWGLGVDKSELMATHWYGKAAELGHAAAQKALDEMGY